MYKKWIKMIREDRANSLVENVIVLPIVFFIIYYMVLAAFIMMDRTTLDAAAKRATIYASKCISDPNYVSILGKVGHQAGELDTTANGAGYGRGAFEGVGNNIKPYRYFKLNTTQIQSEVQTEVDGIIQKTQRPGRNIDTEDIKVKITNYVVYQDVEVSITAKYPLPKVFGAIGLPTEYEYTVSSKTAVNDPDEFIRNVDLIIDTAVAIDSKTGNRFSKIGTKIGDMATKVKKFLEIKN